MGHEKRRDDRYKVGLAARLANDAAQLRAVKVTNVSARGCRFTLADHPLEPGAGLTMTIGPRCLDARVKWRAGKAYGVRFDQPLHAALLDHIRLFLSEEPALVVERDDFAAGA